MVKLKKEDQKATKKTPQRGKKQPKRLGNKNEGSTKKRIRGNRSESERIGDLNINGF